MGKHTFSTFQELCLNMLYIENMLLSPSLGKCISNILGSSKQMFLISCLMCWLCRKLASVKYNSLLPAEWSLQTGPLRGGSVKTAEDDGNKAMNKNKNTTN